MPAMGITASATLGKTWNARSRSADLQHLKGSVDSAFRALRATSQLLVRQVAEESVQRSEADQTPGRTIHGPCFGGGFLMARINRSGNDSSSNSAVAKLCFENFERQAEGFH